MSGREAMAAISGLRTLLVEIHALIAEASRQLGDRGWEQASRSQRVSHLSNRWDKPQDWLPKYLYRWFRHPARPDVLLAMVVHLEEIDGVPPEPWLVMAAFVGTERPPTGAKAAPLSDAEAELFAGGLHVEGEEDEASGQLHRKDMEPGERISLAVPLFSIDGPAALEQRVLAPILGALKA